MRALLLFLSSIMIAKADPSMIEKINQTLDQIRYEASQRPSINLDIKYDPFYHDKKKTTTIKRTMSSKAVKTGKKALILSMILNKKAFINGIWYQENQKVAQYVLSHVNQDSVVLKRKKKTIVLKLKTAKNLLVKKEVK